MFIKLEFNNVIFVNYIDEYQKANKKLKKCEEFSDIQSSTVEDKEQPKKRQPKRNSKYISTSEEEDDENDHSLRRPPKIFTYGKNIF